jgi:hypothetical protein
MLPGSLKMGNQIVGSCGGASPGKGRAIEVRPSITLGITELAADGEVSIAWLIRQAIIGFPEQHGRERASKPPLRLTGWVIVALLAISGAPAHAHDWYTGLSSPMGRNCCNTRDCRSLLPDQVRSANGRLEIFTGNAWVPVPPEVILNMPSPDGQMHACWPQSNPTDLVCVIMPAQI